jgi:hypothetical protein
VILRPKIPVVKNIDRHGIGGRPYIARHCATCGSEAQYAFQVLTRTVGKGQGQKTRKMKLSTTVLLCGTCSRDVERYVTHLEGAAKESLRHVTRLTQQPSGPGLFEQLEA